MDLLNAFSLMLDWSNLFAAFLGVFVGTVVGVLPGIGPVGTMALLLPFTYNMPPLAGLITLAGVYYGAMYGGSTTSILFRVPGEVASVLTSVEGYAMAQKGRAGPALAIAAISSFIAGTIGLLALQLFAPPLARFAITFGPPEYLMIGLAGLIILCNVLGGGFIRNFSVALLGIAAATVGVDTLTGVTRFTFGQFWLSGGFELVSMVMGLYGISELIGLARVSQRLDQVAAVRLRDLYPTVEDLRRTIWPMIRSGPIGFLVGLIPGPAPIIAPFVGYWTERKLTRHPEEFGHGSIEGLATVEGTNNSACMGAMVPLLALGLPLAPATAVLMSGLMIHGVIPGPLLVVEHPEIFWGVIASMFIGNIILVILNLPLVGLFARIVTIPLTVLIPGIAAVMMVGSYALRGSLWDVLVMLGAGLVGYGMKTLDIEPMPLVLGLVLGPVVESSLLQTTIMYGGSPSWLASRPLSAALAILVVVIVVGKLLIKRQKPVRAIAAAEG